jgi:hypothetical protein
MNDINTIYIMDSSSFIHLRRINPIDIYKTPWEKLRNLIVEGRLITHSQVKEEITDGEDFLVDWVRELGNDWIYNVTAYQNKILPKIHKKYPKFIKPENKHDADPFIVALACEKKNTRPLQMTFTKNEYVVVSNEYSAKNRNLQNKWEVVKIPDFCEVYGIPCIDLFECFRREKWEF